MEIARSFVRFPVFVDLIYERHRSQLIAWVVLQLSLMSWRHDSHLALHCSAITILRLLILLFLEFIVTQFAELDYVTTCAERIGKPIPQAAADALEALQYVFILSAALVSCYANTSRWSWVALPSGIAYLGLFCYRFAACTQLIEEKTGDTNAIAHIVSETFDLTFAVVTLFCLLWLELAKLVPGNSDRPLGLKDTRGVSFSRLPGSTPEWLVKVVHGAQLAPLRHHVAAALAFIFCLTVTIVVAILGRNYASGLVTDWWDPLVDTFNGVWAMVGQTQADPGFDMLPEFVQALVASVDHFMGQIAELMNTTGITLLQLAIDIMQSLSLGGSAACVVILLSMSASFMYIHDDYQALDAALPRVSTEGKVVGEVVDAVGITAAANAPLLGGKVFREASAGKGLRTGTGPAAPDSGKSMSMGMGAAYELSDPEAANGETRAASPAPASTGADKESSSEPGAFVKAPVPVALPLPSTSASKAQAQDCVGRYICCCFRKQAIYIPGTNTPDIASSAYSFLSAFNYAALYAINIVTAWVLLTLVFAVAIFFLLSDNPRLDQARWTFFGTLVVNFVYTRVLGWLMGLCVAKGNRVMRPRALQTCDLVLTFTLSAATGVTTGLVRFVMGVVTLIFKLTLLARPVLPGRLATYDTGFMAYSGMMKAAWAGRLHPGSEPQEPQ